MAIGPQRRRRGAPRGVGWLFVLWGLVILGNAAHLVHWPWRLVLAPAWVPGLILLLAWLFCWVAALVLLAVHLCRALWWRRPWGRRQQ